MFPGFDHHRLYQKPASALALLPRRHCDGADFGEVRTIKMQRATADDAAFFFQHNEVPDVLADFRQSSRQQRAVARIGGDQIVDMLCVRQDRLTRAHESPPRWNRPAVWLPPSLAERAPARS